MIEAVRHSLIPLGPMTVPETGAEPRPRTATGRNPDAHRRQPRRIPVQIIDPYLAPHAEATLSEPPQIYDRRCAPVLLAPPSVGRLLNIFA